MKKIHCLFCFVICFLILTGCDDMNKAIVSNKSSTSPKASSVVADSEQIKKREAMDKRVSFLTADVETPKEKLITQKHSLNDLITFFEGYYENPHTGSTTKESYLTIEDINEKFPVECFRYGNASQYIIYEVEEGGFFYVFLISTSDKETLEIKDVCVYKVNYFSQENTINSKSFDELVRGESTATDVFAIDPGMVLDEWGNFIYSYSLTDDGVISVYYRRPVDKSDRSTILNSYIVESIETIDIKSAFIFNQILDIDMPY